MKRDDVDRVCREDRVGPQGTITLPLRLWQLRVGPLSSYPLAQQPHVRLLFYPLPQHARDRPLSSSFVFPPIAPSRWRNWARGALAVAASSFLPPPRATIRYSPSPSNWD